MALCAVCLAGVGEWMVNARVLVCDGWCCAVDSKVDGFGGLAEEGTVVLRDAVREMYVGCG